MHIVTAAAAGGGGGGGGGHQHPIKVHKYTHFLQVSVEVYQHWIPRTLYSSCECFVHQAAGNRSLKYLCVCENDEVKEVEFLTWRVLESSPVHTPEPIQINTTTITCTLLGNFCMHVIFLFIMK